MGAGRYRDRPEKATQGNFLKDSRAGRSRVEDRPSISARSDSARRSSPAHRKEHAIRDTREADRSKGSKPPRRSVTPPMAAEVSVDDLPPHLRS